MADAVLGRRVRMLPSRVVAAFPGVLAPVADRLIAMGVRPNAITAAGAIVLIGAGLAFGLDRPRTGGACLLLAGGLDVLDGLVARRGAMVSAFGGFLDSTLDRIGEALLFMGIALCLVTLPDGPAPALALGVCAAALVGSLLVSYTRALAEGLGIECRVGLAQRAERILGLGVPALLLGAGPHGLVLLVTVAALAAAAWVTVAQRVRHVFVACRGGDLDPGRRAW